MNLKVIGVLSAVQIKDYTLHVVFDDGTVQDLDFKPFLIKALHPDIRAYLDLQRFATFRVEYGDLVWGDYDLCFPIIDLYKNSIEKSNSIEMTA